jgi:cytochrome b6-f complex iron-sulfur subunit
MTMHRRELLHVIVAACASTCIACGPPFGVVSAGNASALAVGDVKVVSGSPVAIARDAQGIYAMTLICTHEGCDISQNGTVTSTTITCDCHGSRFDANGNVIVGPAQSPLQHYKVSADASGNLTIDGNTPVSAATRLAV